MQDALGSCCKPAGQPRDMTHVLLPLALAVGTALAYAAAAAMQRRQTATIGQPVSWRAFLGVLVRQPRWWAGVATMAVGAALHLAALGVGSVSLVQPVNALALVLALPIDARLSQRRVIRGEWISAALVVAGLAALLTVAPRNNRTPPPTSGALLLTVGVVAGVVTIIVVLTARARPVWRGIARAAGAGLCMGTTSASAHLAIDAFTGTRPATTVGIISGAAALTLPLVGLALLQLAYRDGGLDGPLATLTILDPVVATAIGLTLLGERTTYGLAGVIIAAAGGSVALVGLTALIRLKPPPSTSAHAGSPDVPSSSPTGH